eukprot:g2286.t1
MSSISSSSTSRRGDRIAVTADVVSSIPLLNPKLRSSDAVPISYSGEVFLLRRRGCSFKVVTKGKIFKDNTTDTLSSGGELYLTNRRIVFVSGKKKTNPLDLNAFEVPLCTLTEYKFVQPIFGSNYLKGKCTPHWSPMPEFRFQLTFTHGGSGTFLSYFFTVMKRFDEGQARRGIDEGRSRTDGPSTAFYPEYNYVFASQVYRDPNDPSTIIMATLSVTDDDLQAEEEDNEAMVDSTSPPRRSVAEIAASSNEPALVQQLDVQSSRELPMGTRIE